MFTSNQSRLITAFLPKKKEALALLKSSEGLCGGVADLGWLITLGQLVLLNLSGPILIEGLEDALPLVNVIEELLELVQIDRSRVVLVKHICKTQGEGDDLSLCLRDSPCWSSLNSMKPLRSRSMPSNRDFHWLM